MDGLDYGCLPVEECRCRIRGNVGRIEYGSGVD